MHEGETGCSCCGAAFAGFYEACLQARSTQRLPRTGIARRSFLAASALAGSLIGLPAAAAPRPQTRVFRGGTILTVDSRFREAEALAIRGDRILAVGAEADVLKAAGPGATIVELDGKVLLPGFIDPHTHVLAGALADSVMENVGMSRFSTAAEVLAHLTARAAATPKGEWVMARNFDPALQAGPDALTFAELDAVSRDVPVFVMNASGHLAYANRKAFQAANIPADVANPPGAEFVRDDAGRLTGVMKNNVAFLKLASAAPAMARAEPVSALVALLAKWGSLGLTTVSELALGGLTQSPKDVELLSAARRSGQLKARIRAYPFYTVGADAWDKAGVRPGNGDSMVRIAGYKLVADGSNQGFTGLQREPYLNSDSRGTAYMTAEELKAAAVDRARAGWPLALHANGDAAIDVVLDACEAVRDAGIDLARVRPRIEHCSMLHDGQIARMKALGVSASFLIGHVHFWGVWMRDRVFGPDRVNLLGRLNSVDKAGVGYTIHSDFMVTDPDPLHMIQMAVTRTTWKEPGFVLNPAERVQVESAIRALTSEAAWQLFSEHEIGSLEPGKFADMVVLEQDPRKVPADRIRHIRVLETWLNGESVYRAAAG
jgi:predicted amidohydrolase YtcJ